MTNSRLTDPEVLESRFPVVLEDFHIRRGSGGKGQWRAGDGTLRRIRFLKPDERGDPQRPPRRRQSGRDGRRATGELGRNSVRRNDGADRDPARLRRDHVEAGEAIEIVTPTGGGWGKAG